ncbi:MAG: RNA polymerase sigma factor [Myxococcota bacterium]
MADESDETLMARYAAHDDRAAFQLLFERYAGRVQAYFRRGMSDDAAAADLVQITFMHVHRARRDFDTARAFRPWLFAIAANVRREHWRRKARKPEAPLEPGHEGSVPPEASTATDRLVRRAIEQLPDNQREVVVLRWYSGLSFPEIAETLGIQTTAAKVRSHRATKALAALLGGGDD